MRSERVDRALTLLLLAALAAPLAAGAMGMRVPAPFALDRAGLAVLLGAVVLVDGTIAASLRTWPRVAAEALASLLLAIPLALLIGYRANGFYTGIALLEGLAILLAVQLVARTLRRLSVVESVHARPAAFAAADGMVAGALTATIALFVLAWIGVYELAGLSLIVATGLAAFAVLFRLPDSVRGVASALGRTPRRVTLDYRRMLRRIRRARRARLNPRGTTERR